MKLLVDFILNGGTRRFFLFALRNLQGGEWVDSDSSKIGVFKLQISSGFETLLGRGRFMKLFIVGVLFSFIQFSGQAFALPIHQKVSIEKALQSFNQDQSGYNFLGTVKLSGCSGSLIRFENSKDSDPGMILTNGHCVSTNGGMMDANVFMANEPSSKIFQFLNKDGSLMNGTESAVKLVFATITWNDVAIYELKSTFAQIKKKYGVDALTLDSKHPEVGTSIDVLSGYWQQGYSCKIAAFAFELHEGDFVSKDSMRYSSEGCHTIHGTSGSPVLNHETGKVVGINSTGNDAGEKCTMDNPCEVSANGDVFYQKDLSYADETYVIYSCVNAQNKIDLNLPGCQLFHKAN